LARVDDSCQSEIHQLESIDCSNVVLLSDLSSQSLVIGNKWVLKLKYRDDVFDQCKSRLAGLGYQQEKGQDFLKVSAPPVGKLLFD